jgi:hypothetical protein
VGDQNRNSAQQTLLEPSSNSLSNNIDPKNTEVLPIPSGELQHINLKTPTPSSRKHFSKKVYSMVLITVLILIAGGFVWFALHKTSEHSSNSQSSKLANFTPPYVQLSAAEQSRISSGLPPVPATANLAIQYVNIPSDAVNNNLGSYPIATSNGHYVYIQFGSGSGGVSNGDVIYDGKVVYTDPNTSTATENTDFATAPGPVLSQNGLNYGYVLNSGIYIDGKLIPNTTDAGANLGSNGYTLLGISNSGQQYAYLYNNMIYVNGVALSHSSNVVSGNSDNEIALDSDLNNYIGGTSNGYYYNGNMTSSNVDTQGGYFSVSNNGKYYFVYGIHGIAKEVITNSKDNSNPDPNSAQYLVSGYDTTISYAQLMVNGNSMYATKAITNTYKFNNVPGNSPKTTGYSESEYYGDLTYFTFGNGGQSGRPVINNSVYYAGVNDSGDYYYLIGSKSPYLVIDNRYYYPLPAKSLDGSCYPATSDSSGPEVESVNNEMECTLADINDSDSHYVVFNPVNDYLVIDGKSSTLSGKIYNVELENNTLYVYKLTDSSAGSATS